jgi:site-specific DNA-methyltransferase (adenine-specific)
MLVLNDIHHFDCLSGIPLLPPSSVSLVFADLPYGRTANGWDRCIPIDRLWTELRRVCKPAAAIVFTAMQPFTSLVVCSNLKWFRYAMVWRKNKPRGFLNAKKQPLRIHEDVLVFYGKQPPYVPQMTSGHAPVHAYTKNTSDGTNYGSTKRGVTGGGSTQRYPTSILEISVVNNDDPERCHPTQKPRALPEWFIRTYTLPGDLVLDPTAGSGSTLLAAKALGRRYVGFDTDGEMVAKVKSKLL